MASKKSDLCVSLRASCDQLRGGMDASPYKDYVLFMLAQVRSLVIDDKWMATLASRLQGELDRVSQTLTGRVRELAGRYATPLPTLTHEVAALAAKVDAHLARMGVAWI